MSRNSVDRKSHKISLDNLKRMIKHYVIISHKRSLEKIVRKSLSLPRSVADKLDNLFKDKEDNSKVTQLEQSKIINKLFEDFLDQVIKEQQDGTLSVMYEVREHYTFI